MKVAVTGGAGFLGQSLVRGLVERDHFVRIFDDYTRPSQDTRIIELEARGRVEVRECDVRGPALPSFEGFAAIFHLAAINGTRNFYERPREVLDVGIRGTLNVLDACRAAGVQDFVFFSSSEVYQEPPNGNYPTREDVRLVVPDPMNPRYSYGGSKIAGELLTIHSGIDQTLIVRPHNVYGPGMGYDHVIPEFVMQAKRNGRIVMDGDGSEVRSFIYVEDFTRAVLDLWEGGHVGIYNVGNQEPRGIRTVANDVAELVPGCRSYKVGREVKKHAGGTTRRVPDVSQLRAAIRYEPRVSWDEGLPLSVEWYLENETHWPAPR